MAPTTGALAAVLQLAEEAVGATKGKGKGKGKSAAAAFQAASAAALAARAPAPEPSFLAGTMCRCGSTTHMRTNHAQCPLRKKRKRSGKKDETAGLARDM